MLVIGGHYATTRSSRSGEAVSYFSMLLFFVLCVLLSNAINPAHAGLLGASVNGSVIQVQNGGLNYFTQPQSIVVDPGREFQGRKYTSSRVVVDAFADFTDDTISIGFEHIRGDHLLNCGTAHLFEFTDIVFENPSEIITGISLISYTEYSSKPNYYWHVNPGEWTFGFTDNSISILTTTSGPAGGFTVSPECLVSATFSVHIIPEPSSLLFMALGSFLLYRKRR